MGESGGNPPRCLHMYQLYSPVLHPFWRFL